jgi:maleate isomerase
MLTPSSNTVLEPATIALLGPLADRVSVHFSRFRVTRIGLNPDADQQFAQEAILSAAELLADAKPSVIAWNGTSASWLGFDSDRVLCAAIEHRTGVPATSAILALNELLSRWRIRRLGLVTPYTADVEARIIANYRAAGIDIVAQARRDLSDNYSFAEVPEASVESMCREVAEARPDAIAIVCTNLRGPFVAARLEQELGIPIFDSIAVTLRGCLAAARIDTRSLTMFGRLFGELQPA